MTEYYGERKSLNINDDTGSLFYSVTWAATTHVGKLRSLNEDSVLAYAPIFAVADGMGGHEAGEKASAHVIDELAQLAHELNAEEENDDITFIAAGIAEKLIKSVDKMKKELSDEDKTMGTTVSGVAIVTQDKKPYWLSYNIGDSRVYVITEDSGIKQITKDHSIVQHLLDTGAINLEEAENHPQGNIITRAVGVGDDPLPDFTSIPFVKNSWIIICSDGLTKEITDVGIEYFVSQSKNPAFAVGELLKQSLKNSGRDNISIIVIKVD